jgi:hypothetical protein
MNKEKILEALTKKGYAKEIGEKVFDVVSKNINLGKLDKNKIITALKTKLKLSDQDLEKIYNTISSVVTKEAAGKLLSKLTGKK